MTLALLFSPQGSQSVGMGRELAERSPAAAAAFAEADATLGWSVSDACWNGPADRLDDTRQTQPCLLTTSVAAFRALGEAADPAPAIVAGHSVGEYAALVAAGVLELPAALRLVALRAELMAGAGEGGMAAVLGLDRDAVQAVVDGLARPTELVVANDNAPGQVVVSGRHEALELVEEAMRSAGARRVLRLSVSGAFHSPMMAGVAERLAEAFEERDLARRARAGHQQRQRRAADRGDAHPRAACRAGSLAGRVGRVRAPHGRRRRRRDDRVRRRCRARRDGEAHRARSHDRDGHRCGEPRRGGRARRPAGHRLMPVTKVLIANRGEIAVRILRACRDLGLPAVVAFSEADRDTLAVRLADEAICIGPAEARKSYLNQPAVISAAMITGCDSVHPGYGFLSEDATFAEACAAHDLTFIGPRPEVLERFASKYAVRRMLAANGLPTVPGSRGIVTDLGDALEQAGEAGYPVLLKPSAGGGGRGMRLVRSTREMETSLPLARSEAQAAFGDDSIYFEKWIEESRHVEVQVIVDRHGNGVHLGERDCSVQRRHQKIIEEGPSPAMDDASRERLRDLAIRSVVAAGYESAGTLEFLLDAEGNFYFIEINCRIQVEHPVTEALTGVDIIAEQIRIAAGEPLSLRQDSIVFRGHAIEFRINAEDPGDNFSPQTGEIESLALPGGPGVRVDTHLYPGYEVPPFYDSLLAKLIVWGDTREIALARSRRALAEFEVGGVKTNIPFHRGIIDNDAFLDARVSTNLLDRVGPAAFVPS